MSDLDLEQLGSLGWATFEASINEGQRAIVVSACSDLRDTAETYFTTLRDFGLPTQTLFAINCFNQHGGPEKLHVIQAQYKDAHRFGRVSAELTLEDYPVPRDQSVLRQIYEQEQAVRQAAIIAGAETLTMLGIPPIREIPDNPRIFNRAQFIHTWYKPGGQLFGNSGHKVGHRDTSYTGILVSIQTEPDMIGDWTIGEGNEAKSFRQTGNTAVVMNGPDNPYHLVEVPDDSPERHAVLLRLTGEPMKRGLWSFMNQSAQLAEASVGD